MATTETLFAGFSGSKLFLLSGQFTSTVRDSVAIGAIENSLQGISWDGVNTPWTGNNGDKLYLQSGKFTSTLKTSESITTIEASPRDISWDGTNTPWTGDTGDKLYLQSGQFTSTLKTSESITAVEASTTGISWDGTNTPWIGFAGDKLYLQSGQFTSTLKTSLSVSGKVTYEMGISWDGTDTLWTGYSSPKLFLQSGQFTSTVKTSLIVTSLSSISTGIESNDVDSRVNEDQAEFYQTKSTSEFTSSSTTGADAITLTVDRTVKTDTKDFIVIASWGMGHNDVSAGTAASKLVIDGTDYTSFDAITLQEDHGSNGQLLSMFQIAKVSLDSTSHTVKIVAKTSSATAGDEVVIDGASLVCWEMPDDMQYAESLGNSSRTAESYADKVTSTFTSSAEDVLIVAAADVAWDDETDPGAVRITDDDTELIRHEPDGLLDAANDGKYLSVGMVTFLSSDTSSSAVAALEYKGGGTGDDIQIKNARIFALPLGNFTSYKASNTGQSTSSTSLVDLLTTSPTISNSGRHIAFFGAQMGTNSTLDNITMQGSFAGTDNIGPITFIEQYPDYDAGLPISFAAAAGGAINSGARTFAIKWAASGGDGFSDLNKIMVLQVQDASDPPAPGDGGKLLTLLGAGS